MSAHHFVKDYSRHVDSLIAAHPIDQAMSLAVGGDYHKIGDIASEIVLYAAPEAVSYLDFGCGSGRVAHHLAKKTTVISYIGIDVVQRLLDYAAEMTPPHFTFKVNHSLNLPVDSKSVDCAFAFSVFTHLQQAEIFIYLLELSRSLMPGGKFVFSFLEFSSPSHWRVMEETVTALESGHLSHLNTFTDRGQLSVLASHAGLEVVEYIDGTDCRWAGQSLGQSIGIFQKPLRCA